MGCRAAACRRGRRSAGRRCARGEAARLQVDDDLAGGGRARPGRARGRCGRCSTTWLPSRSARRRPSVTGTHAAGSGGKHSRNDVPRSPATDRSSARSLSRTGAQPVRDRLVVVGQRAMASSTRSRGRSSPRQCTDSSTALCTTAPGQRGVHRTACPSRPGDGPRTRARMVSVCLETHRESPGPARWSRRPAPPRARPAARGAARHRTPVGPRPGAEQLDQVPLGRVERRWHEVGHPPILRTPRDTRRLSRGSRRDGPGDPRDCRRRWGGWGPWKPRPCGSPPPPESSARLPAAGAWSCPPSAAPLASRG